MRPGIGVERILIAASAMVAASAGTAWGALPPGRPYELTIKGENTVTFLPEIGLAPLSIDYKASIEYLVDTRNIEPGSTNEATNGKKAQGHARDRSRPEEGRR